MTAPQPPQQGARNERHQLVQNSRRQLRARRYLYERILNTTLHIDTSFPGMRMAIFPLNVHLSVARYSNTPKARPHADGVRIYLNGGDDLGPILQQVFDAGGKVIMPKTFLRNDIGHIGMFADCEGNIIGLLHGLSARQSHVRQGRRVQSPPSQPATHLCAAPIAFSALWNSCAAKRLATGPWLASSFRDFAAHAVP